MNRWTYVPRRRQPTWKQDTPQEQFVAVMQSVEGWICNLEKGVSAQKRCLEHIKKGLEELKGLQAYMESNWESDEPPATDPEHSREPQS